MMDKNDTTLEQERLAENTVEYFLFIIDADSNPRNLVTTLESVRKAALQLCQSLTKDYIWQREGFDLELRNDQGLIYLHGVTDYGDAVEDEWLIVYMLRELTKSYPALWVRVVDSDGEFLLVEAANVLPAWLSPEMDQNRVWIQGGKLFIVPVSKDAPAAASSKSLSLTQAIEFLKSKPGTIVNSSFIESEAFYRLEKYPGQISDSIHHSIVTIPRQLAYVLHSLPKSVAPAVESFYTRDAISLKPVVSASMPLSFPPGDLVTTSVRFSKILFAQLRSQRFDTPPRWLGAVQRTQESINDGESTDSNYARLETGMKLTCGFEMLSANAEKSKLRVVRELAIILEDLKEDGEAALPSDEEIKTWPNSRLDDNEAWMDINYQDFERELEGRPSHASSKDAKSGFGDAQTHADLKKIVSRFESFLNDKGAGIDGAELNEMDVDDDSMDDEETDEDSEFEDKEVSFDEEVFSRMMKEMMGLPETEPRPNVERKKAADTEKLSGLGSAPANEESEGIQEIASQLEAELKEYGALKLDPPDANQRLVKGKGKASGSRSAHGADSEASDEDTDAELDIDYNLARNLLESFKSQAGMAGPTGNMLAMMGFQLPRDEGDAEDENEEAQNVETGGS